MIKKYGLVVDSVSDVLTINSENIQEDIDMHVGIDSRYIMGLVKANEQMIILVDIDKVFLKDELDDLSDAVNNSIVNKKIINTVMSSHRILRVNENIKQTLSLIIMREIEDPRIKK
ncbi:chemotaxis protein CheW [Brachyspira hyodysenteriae]|nr:chemotaxis protein CheW [Brachyspira hyodysenteriae]MDA1468588.1 chemotaxis protein CheW [Brachyspira hyodysenteriae]